MTDEELVEHLREVHQVEVVPGGLRFFGGHLLELDPGEPFDLWAFHEDLHARGRR